MYFESNYGPLKAKKSSKLGMFNSYMHVYQFQSKDVNVIVVQLDVFARVMILCDLLCCPLSRNVWKF